MRRRLRNKIRFLEAAAKGDVKLVKYYVSVKKVDVNTVHSSWNALHTAVAYGHRVLVTYLIKNYPNLNINAVTRGGNKTALIIAIQKSSISITLELLDAGASRQGITPDLLCNVTHPIILERLSTTTSWSVKWSPTLHRQFPIDERRRIYQLLLANFKAGRKTCGKHYYYYYYYYWWYYYYHKQDKTKQWKYLPSELLYRIFEYAVWLE